MRETMKVSGETSDWHLTRSLQNGGDRLKLLKRPQKLGEGFPVEEREREPSSLNEESAHLQNHLQEPLPLGNATDVEDRWYWIESRCLLGILKKLNFKNLLLIWAPDICLSNKQGVENWVFSLIEVLLYVSKDHLLLLLVLSSKSPLRVGLTLSATCP